MIVLTISKPPPSVNSRWRHDRAGNVHVEPSQARWDKLAAWEIKLQARTLRFLTPVYVDAEIERPKSRRDLDNTSKALCDSLVHSGLLKDDDLIHDLRLRWADVEGTRITIGELA